MEPFRSLGPERCYVALSERAVAEGVVAREIRYGWVEGGADGHTAYLVRLVDGEEGSCRVWQSSTEVFETCRAAWFAAWSFVRELGASVVAEPREHALVAARLVGARALAPAGRTRTIVA